MALRVSWENLGDVRDTVDLSRGLASNGFSLCDVSVAHTTCGRYIGGHTQKRPSTLQTELVVGLHNFPQEIDTNMTGESAALVRARECRYTGG